MSSLWILLTAFFGFQAKDLKPDFEFEKLFPINDPDITFYQEHLQHFGYDNDFLMLMLEWKPLFDSGFLSSVKHLTAELKNINGTVEVISPIEMEQLIEGPMGKFSIPIIHIGEPEKYAFDSIRIYGHPLYSGFFGKSGNSLLIQIEHDHFTQPETGDAYIKAISQTLKKHGLNKNRIVGKLTAQNEFISLIQKDFVFYIVVALAIGFLLLLLLFRSLRSALLPYLISVTSLIWLLGLMAWSGTQITILGSLIPPIILFVSTSDAIHLLNAYKSSQNPDPTKHLNRALKKIFIPTILTSVTTAIGFFSLLLIDVEPVRSFGIYTGIGVIIAFIVTFLFGPLLIYNWNTRPNKTGVYKPFVVLLIKKRKVILLGSSLLFCLSIFGLLKLETNAYLLDNLPDDSEVGGNFEWAEKEYFGFKPFEIAFWPTSEDQTIWDQEVLSEANKIQDYLLTEYPAGRIWSPVSFMDYGNQMVSGGQPETYRFPEAANYNKVRKALNDIWSLDNTVQNTVSKDQKYARIVGSIPELGSKETIERNRKLEEYISQNIDLGTINYRITGTTYLIDKSHSFLSKNLIYGLLIAVLLVSLVLGFYFKSIKILLISLVPNLLPLMITAGFMGFAGIPLKLTTSIIFAVSFGIAVDDTIHFISVYRSQKHKNAVYRLIRTFNTAGKAIIITSVIILAGFSIFLFSSFGATYYLGLFICLSLSSALIIDLTLLPILILYLNKK